MNDQTLNITGKNGVRILLYPRPGAMSFSIGVFVKAGAWDEKPSQAGIAHCIEHMLFRSSEFKTTKQIADHFASLGAETNAFTDWDMTVYHATAPSMNAKTVVADLTSMIRYPKFDEKEFDVERKAILSEIARRNDDPATTTSEAAHSLLFCQEKRFGGTIIGTEATVNQLTVDDLRNFHKKHYVASNICIVAVGGMDATNLGAFILNQWGDLRRGATSVVSVKSSKAGSDLFFRESQQVHLSQHIRYDVQPLTIAWYALDALISIYAGGMHARLQREIRDKRGLAYATYGYAASYGRTTVEFQTYVGTDAENVAKARDIVSRIQMDLADNKVSGAELNRAKNVLCGEYQIMHDKFPLFMKLAGSRFLIYDKALDVNEYMCKLDDVTSEDVRAVAQEVFCNCNSSTVFGARLCDLSQDFKKSVTGEK